MSPEQMRSSRDADERSDIWGLGAVLFTLLAGVCPFPGQFLTEVCAAVLSGTSVELRTLRPEVPEALEAVIMRCLSLDPQNRFQKVPDLAAALEPFVSSGGAELVARVKRIAAAAEAEPQSEAPLSLSNHAEAAPHLDTPKAGASVSAAVMIGPAPRTGPRAFVRGAVVGAVSIGVIGIIIRLWTAETGDSHGTTAHASVVPVSAPEILTPVRPSTDSMEPNAVGSASPASPPLAPPSPTLAAAARTSVQSSSKKQSHSAQSQASRKLPVPRRAGSPSDEDLILSLPH